MSRGVWQATIADELGNVLAGASVTVRNQSGVLVALYNAAIGGSALSNPLFSDAEGFVRFYTDSGLVNIVATSNGDTRSWLQVVIAGTAAVADSVGTVSQSGGVPTGAIIERGSNANGEYVKFADGTLICTGVISLNDNLGSTVNGWYRLNQNASSFASIFITIPRINFSVANAGTTGSYSIVASDTSNNPTTTSYTGRVRGLVLGPTDTIELYFVAIGRWF